ncbi:MAG TPA: cation diffusion facilitator family transporter, partial [Rectinemataceae bacterium]
GSPRAGIIERASWIAFWGNLLLAALKLGAGALSGSLAVLSDGLDSATDVLIAILTLAAAKISSKPGDLEHPYGHGRIETVSTAIISLVIFFAGGQVFIKAIQGLVDHGEAALPGALALWATIASILGKIALAWSQFHYGKRSGSAMLIANGKNMRGDVVTSIAVLLGLSLAILTRIPAMDEIAALLVSLWILKNAVSIFLEANMELMDGTNDHGPYAELFAAIGSVPEAGNPHRVRLRKLGSLFIADLDIEVDPSMSVGDAHHVAVRVERAIKETMPEVYDVIVHVEPCGNVEEERFGLSQADNPGSG